MNLHARVRALRNGGLGRAAIASILNLEESDVETVNRGGSVSLAGALVVYEWEDATEFTTPVEESDETYHPVDAVEWAPSTTGLYILTLGFDVELGSQEVAEYAGLAVAVSSVAIAAPSTARFDPNPPAEGWNTTTYAYTVLLGAGDTITLAHATNMDPPPSFRNLSLRVLGL